MVLVEGKKYACESCIRGHRSGACAHIHRQLIPVKRKGRPITQCPECRELRREKQVHVKCSCGETHSASSSTTDSPVRSVARHERHFSSPHDTDHRLNASLPPDRAHQTSSCHAEPRPEKCACAQGGRCQCSLQHGTPDQSESRSNGPGTLPMLGTSNLLAPFDMGLPTFPFPLVVDTALDHVRPETCTCDPVSCRCIGCVIHGNSSLPAHKHFHSAQALSGSVDRLLKGQDIDHDEIEGECNHCTATCFSCPPDKTLLQTLDGSTLSAEALNAAHPALPPTFAQMASPSATALPPTIASLPSFASLASYDATRNLVSPLSTETMERDLQDAGFCVCSKCRCLET